MTTAAALADAVAANPLPGFSEWWPIGDGFATLMSDAIVSEWSALAGSAGDLETVGEHATEYLDIVYQRDARASLVQDFAAEAFSTPLESGEFDALSYAFYRSAFDLIEANPDAYEEPLEAERRNFTRRVGRRAFATLADRLGLDLPAGLDDQAGFEMLKAAIDSITTFLKQDGYFRDHGAFVFEVDVEHQGQRLGQPEAEFVDRLQTAGSAHALFEMGYPVILPSAVYLFATVGEAQHHSSRTVEELFARVGYVASETHDFDPSGYPPDMVVELWEVRKR
tara:strand:+ start:2302 stop:3144 length:843 start_codon:yes stop_codon:yes gene_type:complete